MINKKNIQIAQGNISLINRQINNEAYERLLIVKNITYLHENIYIITKQKNKVNESITNTKQDIKTEI